jgi:hypothetical protein
MGWLQQMRLWWQRRQLANMLLEQLRQGKGVTHTTWEAGTPIETVLAWYDDQVARARTPYGMSALKLAVLGEAGPPLYEALLPRRSAWEAAQRDQLAAALAPLLAKQTITTAVASFGGALHTLLDKRTGR